MGEATLSLQDVGRHFGRTVAVENVTLDLRPGERVALIGHNGAGKTTLMKLILGLISPTSGRLTVLGDQPGGDHARRHVAFLPESIAFHRSMTGREALALFARLKAVPRDEVAGLLAKVGLEAAADRRIHTYSKGMRQRLGLAQALLGRPRLLLLDEPTSGLDPDFRQTFYHMIDRLAAAGATILLSSHLLTELEARTDRIAIMRRGRLTAAGPLDRLRRDAALPVRIRVDVREVDRGRVAAALAGREINGQAVDLLVPADRKMAMLARIAGLGDVVRDVELVPPSLDDLYAHYSRLDEVETAERDLS